MLPMTIADVKFDRNVLEDTKLKSQTAQRCNNLQCLKGNIYLK